MPKRAKTVKPDPDAPLVASPVVAGDERAALQAALYRLAGKPEAVGEFEALRAKLAAL